MQTIFVLVFCAANAGAYPAGCQTLGTAVTREGCEVARVHYVRQRGALLRPGSLYCARRDEV